MQAHQQKSASREVFGRDVLSPSLFDLHTEKILIEVADRNGVNIGGVNISNLRCADDTALEAQT